MKFFDIDLSSGDKKKQESLIEKQYRQGSDLKQGFYIMIKSHFGLSLLTLPYFAVNSGYIMAIFLIIFVNMMLTKTMNLLCEVANEVPYTTQTFGNVINIHLGSKAAQLISILLISGSIGTCIAYLLFFQIFTKNLFNNFGFDPQSIYLYLLCLIITLPLSFLKTVERLSTLTKYGFYVCGTIIGINLLYNFEVLLTNISTIQMKTFETSRFIEMYGIIMAIYPYIIFFSVRNALSQPQNDMTKVIYYCNTTSLITQILYSISHLMIYSQDEIQEIALYNLPKSLLHSLCQFLYGATLLINFPITLNGAIQAIEIQADTRVYNNENPPDILPTKSIVIRTSLVLVISILAFLVPSLSRWLSSIGLIKANTFSVLFPVILHYLQNKNSLSNSQKIQHFFFLLIGIIGLGMGFIQFFKMFL